MERKYKITIPEPCHEDWNKMTPNETGRFCINCAKTVVDFTTMLPEEVQHFFIQNQNQSICGRISKSQLNSITIQIPNQVLYSQTQYHKIFLLALFIAMGTTLFSCADKDGNKQKIDKIEVVSKPKPEVDRIMVGDVKHNPNDTLHNIPPPPPPPKVNQIKFIKPKAINCSETSKQNNNVEVEDVIYNGGIGFEIAPEYDGGIEKFYTFFGNEFKTPENIEKTSTKITISFVVEKNGSLSYIKPTYSIDEALEKEIIRVLKLSSKWKPGEQNGKKTRTQYSMPISLL